MSRACALLNLYLIVRIVVCPCLSGGDFHDPYARRFFLWADPLRQEAGTDLADPIDGTSDSESCMCDGADAPDCPTCPPPDPAGSLLTHLDLHAPPVSGIPCEAKPDPSARPPTPIGPPPHDALSVRAQLQNYRC